ncbi:DNA cytosine methyltransferase [Candidatus Poseidoniaceae archaeon]|nr:DNA cytosine methyltransferase [Candidatus Poseidoniaceae archaeon]
MAGEMIPNVSICGASNDKSQIWSRISDSLGTTTESALVGSRFFGVEKHHQSIEIIEHEYCFDKSPKCGSCPLMHHCSHYAKSSDEDEDSPTFADLFSGAGGLGLGFEQAEFNPKLSIDKDEWAIFSHSYNHPLKQGISICADISEWLKNPKNRVEVDVLMGGPPCQSFSNANKQRQKDDLRDELYKLFVESIPLFNPKVILIENVRGFERVIPELRRLVEKKSYVTTVLKLNARDYGVPQNRSRVFTIGVSIDRYGVKTSKEILDRIEKKIHMAKIKEIPLSDAISDLPHLKASRMKNNTSHESNENGYTIQKILSDSSNYVLEINHNVKPVICFNHKARYNNDRDIEIFSRLKPGEDSTADSIQDINPYKTRNDIFKDKYFKLRPGIPCKTITAHMRLDCNMYIHPNQARGLTVREAARVQGFPDNYVFCGTLQAMYRQIGNAVPPPLAKIIASAIRSEVVN